ncbi:MAG: hypothetical protein ACK56W_25810 [Pirellula sp.]
MLQLIANGRLSEGWMNLIIVVGCLVKTAFFGTENRKDSLANNGK